MAAKARGVVLGNPKLDEVRARAVASVKADADRFAKNVAPIISEIQSSGVASHRGIAKSLNARGVPTARGGKWEAVQVGSILQPVGRAACPSQSRLARARGPGCWTFSTLPCGRRGAGRRIAYGPEAKIIGSPYLSMSIPCWGEGSEWIVESRGHRQLSLDLASK
jgi:hypothetical protein